MAARPCLPVAVADDAGRVWRLSFSPRRLSPSTGRLTAGWAAFCAAHRVRVGDSVVFDRLPGAAPGEPTARVTVVRGGRQGGGGAGDSRADASADASADAAAALVALGGR